MVLMVSLGWYGVCSLCISIMLKLFLSRLVRVLFMGIVLWGMVSISGFWFW